MVEDMVVFERELFRAGFEKEVEWIEYGHLGDEIDFDEELAGFFGEYETGEVVRLRILLPVDEVFLRGHAQGVAQNARA